MSLTTSQFKKVALVAARAADEKQAGDVLLLDLREAHSGLCDFMLVVSANSEVHLRALREHLEETLESLGLAHIHKDGSHSGRWAILDYGGLLVHILHERAREFYAVERLWENARHVGWEAKVPAGNGHAKPRAKAAAKPKKKHA